MEEREAFSIRKLRRRRRDEIATRDESQVGWYLVEVLGGLLD